MCVSASNSRSIKPDVRRSRLAQPTITSIPRHQPNLSPHGHPSQRHSEGAVMRTNPDGQHYRSSAREPPGNVSYARTFNGEPQSGSRPPYVTPPPPPPSPPILLFPPPPLPPLPPPLPPPRLPPLTQFFFSPSPPPPSRYPVSPPPPPSPSSFASFLPLLLPFPPNPPPPPPPAPLFTQ